MESDDPIEEGPQGIAGSPDGPESGASYCEEWESLAAEALDGSLETAQAAVFEQHRRQCRSCAEAWEQCRRGAEWLCFVCDRPQPPAGLVDAILAATSGNRLPDVVQEPIGRPIFWRNPPASGRVNAPGLAAPSLVAPGRGTSRVGASRFFMTAAMAFFSLALTLSLLSAPGSNAKATSARPAEVPFFKMLLSSLSPSSVGRMATRQYYSLQERGAKFYDNLPLVRELEAETRVLSLSNEAQPQGGMAPAPQDASPRSRNSGGDASPRPLRAGEVAGNRTEPGYLRSVEQPALNPETHRFAEQSQPNSGQPYWSRA